MKPDQRYQVSDADQATFAKDGAIVLRGIVGDSWLERLRTAIDRSFKQNEYYFHYIYVWERDPELADFCFHSSLAEMAARLLRTKKVNLLYDQIFVKDAG